MQIRMRSSNNPGTAILVLALALAFTPGICAAQNGSIQVGASGAQDVRQIERLALRVVRSEFTKRGVTDLTTVGWDPSVDASMNPLRVKRDIASVAAMLEELGGREFSSDSVAPNSFHCHLNGLSRLIYLSTPAITGDSATIRVLYNFKSQQSECHFFAESKTFSFARRGAAWVYTGIQGGVIFT
jgi:hypothetical protein